MLAVKCIWFNDIKQKSMYKWYVPKSNVFYFPSYWPISPSRPQTTMIAFDKIFNFKWQSTWNPFLGILLSFQQMKLISINIVCHTLKFIVKNETTTSNGFTKSLIWAIDIFDNKRLLVLVVVRWNGFGPISLFFSLFQYKFDSSITNGISHTNHILKKYVFYSTKSPNILQT